MSNTTLVHDLIMKEGQRTLRNNSVFVNALTAQYDASYASHGAKAGSDIRISQPQEFSVRTGKTIDVQDVEEKAVTISRSVQRGIDIKYSSAEITQDLDSFNRTKVEPAMATLAAYIDNYCMDLAYKEIYQAVALPATNMDRVDILNAGVKLDNGSTPRGVESRCSLLSPQGMADVVNDSSGLFNNASSVSQQYDDGLVKVPAMGFTFGMSQNMPSHTTGGYDANYVTNGAGVEGASQILIDTGTGTITAGDIFTVADCYSVNALTKQSTGVLQQFVATAASAGGTVTVATSPALISTGPYQNIDSLPGNGKAVTFLGVASTAYPQNLHFHKGFGAIGFCDLDVPKGNVVSRRVVEDGISLRLVDFYDGKNDDSYMRFDVLFGYKTVIPRWACRSYQP